MRRSRIPIGSPGRLPAVNSPEKRKQQRIAAAGEVEVVVEEINSVVTIRGRLVDVSPGGFRAAHAYAALKNGLTVRFRHPGAAGRARVIWNRIAGEGIETGFLVLSETR